MVLDVIDDEKLDKDASKGNSPRPNAIPNPWTLPTSNNNPTFWKPWFVSLMRILLLIEAMT